MTSRDRMEVDRLFDERQQRNVHLSFAMRINVKRTT